jgi:hypothetical protein
MAASLLRIIRWLRLALFRLCRLAFILALVALPVPLTAWVVVLLEPLRRSVPTQVLHKDQAFPEKK